MLRGCEPISAGFYNVDTGNCAGKSESMDLESRAEEDARLIKFVDYGHGIKYGGNPSLSIREDLEK